MRPAAFDDQGLTRGTTVYVGNFEEIKDALLSFVVLGSCQGACEPFGC